MDINGAERSAFAEITDNGLIHDLEQVLAEQTRQSAENVTIEQIVEAALLKDSSVDDCLVLTRETETSERELVAYVVMSGPFSSERLQSHLQAVVPGTCVPSAYVPVSTLPLTPTGQVDKHALASLEAINADLLQRWEERLQVLPEVEQVAAVVQEYVEKVPPLHLSDLLLSFQPQGAIAVEQSVAAQVSPPGVQLKSGPKRLAICHGGPLSEEPGAPTTTLSETLQRAALQTVGNSIIYLQPDGSESLESYAALLERAERILAGLRKLGLKPQDKVIFQLDQNPDIIAAFWGCILGGFVPVIIAIPPAYSEYNSALDKLTYVWKLLDKPLILISKALREAVYSVSKLLTGHENLQVVDVEEIRDNDVDKLHHLSQPDDVAFFNLTSGSTGLPKCITLTHRNILSRARGTIQLCQHSSEDTILNWLPFDHIGSISDWHLRCVYLGCKLVYLPKEYVLGRPVNWLNLIDKYRITHSFAPNFAYSLINEALKQVGETPQWDLSCVKSLLTAGEAVSASVVEEFQKNLYPYKLKETTIQPAFGMAEFGSGITYFQHTKENHPKFYTVGRSSLGGAVINVSPQQPNSITFTSLGPVISGASMRIVSRDNIILPEDTVGRLQVKGEAVSPGYYKAPEANQEVFLDDGWFDTGDLGFISKGHLVITGRAKETIIINGANYYNGEIEAVVEEVEGVDVSYTAACSVRDSNSDTEKLAIFFSSSVSDDDRLIKLIGKIQEKVVKKVGVNPAYVIPVEREAIPKTAIGKIQRSQLSRSFEAGEFDTILKQLDISNGNANTLPDWFYRKIWRSKEAVSLATQPTTGQSLIFLDQLGLGALLCEELGKLNLPCVGVEAGWEFAKISDNRYRINPNNPSHYLQLIESLSENNISIAQVLHLWNYDEYGGEISSPEVLEQSQELGVYSLLFLIQALVGYRSSEHSVRLYVIASHTQPTSPSDEIACEKAPVLGLLKTIPQEMPWLDCRHVDVTLDRIEVNAAHILQEIQTTRKEREVAYRNGQRLVARLEKADLRHEEKQEVPFKRGGMYLLSGGLGGIGVEIAQYLLKHYRTRLLLVGRTELPEKSTWETYLDQEDTVSQRIKAYLSLEQLGGELVYEAVDICNLGQLQQVVDRAKSRWQCELDGVIHLAGIAQKQMLVEETRDSLAAMLRPKVLGTWVLSQLLKDKPNSILISSSSVNGFFGGTSVGAYAAANSFLDCFSHYQRYQRSLQSYCFAWSMWDEVGMSCGYQMKELSRAQAYHAITAEQGLQSLLAGLHHNQPSLVVGLDGSNRHIRRYTETKSYRLQTCAVYFTTKTEQIPLTQLEALWVQDRFRTRSTCRFLQLPEMPLTHTGEIDREQVATLERQVSNERVAPRTELERQIASIWQEVLGVQGVGIHDNFFELGGHSLLTTQVISRVRDAFGIELPMRRLFEAPTVAGLSEHIEAARLYQSQLVPPLRPVSRDGEMPMSFAQQRLWFLDQLIGESSTYNIPVALKISGPLNVHALEMAVQEIVRRHEALRTTFPMLNGSPVQAIAPAPTVTQSLVDLQQLPEVEQTASVQQLAIEEQARPFNLVKDSLLRVTLLRLGEESHVLLATMHHIVSDGWSMGILIRELATLYEAYSTGVPSSLPELPIQYADFAVWQRQWLTSEVLETQLTYWKQQLAGTPPLLKLPTDRAHSPVKTFRGGTEHFQLNRDLTRKLNTLSQRSGATLYMVLLATFAILLSRYSTQEDIVVGSPIANRNHSETESLIGFFVNTLVLRTDLSGNPTFQELLGRVRQVALDAYAHQDMPFEQLVEVLQPERNLSHTPLFQVMFVLQNAPMGKLELPGVTITPLEIKSLGAKFDLTLSMEETESELKGFLEYNADLFDAATITRIARHFQNLLEGIVAHPQQRLSELPLLTVAQRYQLLVEWNDTRAEYSQFQCIHQLFEAQVERTPNAPAVVFEDQHLSYRELNYRANCLAHHLQALGVGPEVLVGICVERSLEMVVGLLSILKAGGAYVPLDPTYPQERLALMLEDAQVSVLLTQKNLVAKLPEQRAHVVCLDRDWGVISQESSENPVSGVKPDNLAYVIYTSGSTGRPKGVLVPHRGLLNLVLWHQRAFEVTASDRATQLAGTAFDASVWELWPYLTAGARLYLVESDLLNSPMHLRDWLMSKEITISFLPTPLAEGLLSLEWPENLALRIVLTGGDKLHHYPSASVPFKVVNNYGPTENTVVTTSGLVVSNGRDDISPSIGRPITNTQIYLLDPQLQPVPIGVPGELHIGGASLACGYLNRPQLTAEKFIPNPFSDEPGARLYKTGDLARYLPDGNIEFFGRIDHQVKIRGFRIELGEIEAVLGQHPAVRAAVVIVREDMPGQKRLVAYLVANQQPALSNSELRSFLKEKLPDYMVPSAFVMLSALPLTPNGKVDRRSLPAPDQESPERQGTFVVPRTPVEDLLAGIWANVLGIQQVGIHDNFFELGGHSLLATQVISRVRDTLQVELPVRSLFEASTVAGLAKSIEIARWAEQDLQALPLLPVSRDKDFPLSFAQQRLWLLDQLQPGTPVYNIPMAARLTGLLNVAALEQSLNEILRRHESLRTTFLAMDGKPVQVIAPACTFTLPAIDLQIFPELERETQVHLLVTEEAQLPFDLARDLLLRAKLLRLAEEEHVLLLTMHHTVADGWSMGVFVRELAVLYDAFSIGSASPLPELTIQYADFAVWQRQWLQGEVLETQLSYWKQQLGGSLSMLQLPTDHPRPPVETFRGARQSLVLSPALTKAVKALSHQEGVTLFMTLLAAFQTLLYRYSGQEDILVGTPIANRNRVEIEGLIGFFANTLVLRTNLSGNPSFQELLGRVREVTLGAYAHQDLPFEKLVEELQPERDLSRNPLFQVMLVLENQPMPTLELPGLALSPLKIDSGTAKFDLVLSMAEEVDGLSGVLEYNTDLFDTSTITRMLEHFRVMLEGIVANPEQRLSTWLLLTETERQTLLVEWNDTKKGYPHERCIHELFEVQVERSPDAIVVAFKDEKLTYRELNCRANQVAHHLQTWDVGPEELVGICMERSLEMVIGLLGILKAGGAYVPLDPAYPQERLAFTIKDAQVAVLLTQQRLVAGLPENGAKVVCLDSDWEVLVRESEENPTSGAKPENLAYAIYTSGSTGRPKGIGMSHYSLCNLISWQLQSPTFLGGARTLQFTSLSFDVSFQEIFSTFCSGGTLVMLSEELRRDAVRLLRFLTDEAIERLFLPFVALQQLAEVADDQGPVPTNLREIITAGEQLQITQQIVNLFGKLKAGTLHNHYGPSESHVVTAFTLTGSPSSWPALPPIGRPISNTQLYLLDGNLQPVPIGVPGELYIGGVSLARGYINRFELTPLKFIPNPFSDEPGARLYKTGDLVRYLPNGNIEFLGRIDHQVKIRGFRIELGEVEAALGQHPAVRQTVVVAREDQPGDKRLVAYVVPHQDLALTSNELRSFLNEKLPDYMIPSVFVLLYALPLTPNGKVDRRALPVPDWARPALSAGFVAPSETLEHQLTQIWEELLGIQPIGIKDNFFELGGHSLLAVRMVHQIEQVCGKKLPLSTLFAGATVEHLASVLRQQDRRDFFESPLVEIQSGGSKRPFFFFHGQFNNGGGLYCLNLARYLGEDQPFYAIHPHGFDGGQIPPTIETIAADRLKLLRAIQPEGPYLLGGYCNGGLVAFEMARQLHAQGQKVDLLLLIEAAAANHLRFQFLYSLVSSFGYSLGLDLETQLNCFIRLRNFIVSLKRLSQIDEQIALVLRSLKKVRRTIKWLASNFMFSTGDDNAFTPKDPEHIRYMFYTTRVLSGYIPQPYLGPVTLFRVDEAPAELSDEPTWGWCEVAQEVNVHLLPGDHSTCITTHAQVVAEKLRNCLDEAQAAD